MKTSNKHIHRLLSLLFIASSFITSCGDQNSNHEQSPADTQKVSALPADPAHYVHYVAKDAACGGQYPCYSAIQTAINDAAAGDTVQVLTGRYEENISLKSGVAVQGAGAATTVIYGKLAGSVVSALNVDSAARIDGFTLTGGLSNGGGGIYSKGSSLTISNMTITGNTARYWGGGIINEHGSPTIFNVTITGNTAMIGGGILNDECSPAITNVTISGNTAQKAGGIYNYISSPTIANSTITGNSAVNGGGIYNEYISLPAIYNTSISGNTATQWGGGIYNYLSSSPNILNSTIDGNSAVYGGGGIYSDSNAPLLVQNSIITSNGGGGILIKQRGTSATSNYNDVWNNSGYDYSGLSAGKNDISADPRFVNAATGDYRLVADSPCIDAGSNAAVTGAVSTDLYGNPRLLDGNDDGTTVVDMGVSEYLIALTVRIDAPMNHVALQDVTTLQATTTGARSVEFFVRQPGGTEGIPIGYDNLTATFDLRPVTWSRMLNTVDLPDGYYTVFARARSVTGQVVTSGMVTCTIRNWGAVNFLPATQESNAGRTIPIKFAIRVNAGVDPNQPFVHNESLKIMIYKSVNPTFIQTSYFGVNTTDYRIDDVGQLYITNFKTEKTPAEYTVLIMRPGFIVDQFKFVTIK